MLVEFTKTVNLGNRIVFELVHTRRDMALKLVWPYHHSWCIIGFIAIVVWSEWL